MTIELVEYDQRARSAIQTFWKNRQRAQEKQLQVGRTDQGARSSVTGGKNMDGFISLLADVVRANGLTDADIHLTRKVVTLPGYFRPTKLWDVVVTHRGRLVAALECKSHVGSFGNNFNNRAEEAIGTAHDFWTAFRKGAFGEQTRPFLGWLVVVEDAPASRKSLAPHSPHGPLFSEFADASYADRYNILCRKLVQESLYAVASVLLSPRSAAESGEYTELSKLTGLRTFVAELAGHIAKEAAL